ncbi:MAG: hypothetical protein V7603_5085 [Micromonosporaceae bacterium]
MKTPLLAALIAAGLAAGLLLIIAGVVGTRREPGPPSRLATKVRLFWTGGGRSKRRRRARQTLIVTAVLATIGVWLLSGWPVAGLIAGAAVVGVPWLFTIGRDAKAAIDRLRAVEAWIRRLRDAVSVGVGLQQAIATSRRYTPSEIAEEVGDLVARLQAGWNVRDALLRFADDLDDAAGDQVVASLLLHATDRSEHLVDVLTSIADTAAKEVSMRAMVEAQRAEPRLVTKIMTGLTFLTILIGAFVPTYVRPYRGVLGQLVLFGLAAMLVALLVWIRLLTAPVQVPRFLNVDGEGAPR